MGCICRIWQHNKDADVAMRFIGYEDLVSKFGQPAVKNYEQVFEGDLGTDDLEQIYAICRNEAPEGYSGHKMSLSDVVELCDSSGSRYFYCDRVGFRQIRFV